MLGLFTKRIGSNLNKQITRAVNTPATSTLPSVFDTIIKLTFIDSSGLRRVVPGFIGKTLHETADVHGIDIGPSSVGAPIPSSSRSQNQW